MASCRSRKSSPLICHDTPRSQFWYWDPFPYSPIPRIYPVGNDFLVTSPLKWVYKSLTRPTVIDLGWQFFVLVTRSMRCWIVFCNCLHCSKSLLTDVGIIFLISYCLLPLPVSQPCITVDVKEAHNEEIWWNCLDFRYQSDVDPTWLNQSTVGRRGRSKYWTTPWMHQTSKSSSHTSPNEGKSAQDHMQLI